MRGLAVVLAGSLLAGGCAADTYRIPTSDLARLAHLPPEARGQRVRVIQEVIATDVNPAPAVIGDGDVVIVPQVNVDVAGGIRPSRSGGGGFRTGGLGKIGGAGADGKAAAVAFLVLAATAMITAAAIEGSRFDGYAQLHPMHPVHLIGHDGSQTVVPLAWIDPRAVAWADTAVVRPSEGPWLSLERAPLSRIKTAAREQDYHSLREAAVAAVLAGETTLEEVNRVTTID